MGVTFVANTADGGKYFHREDIKKNGNYSNDYHCCWIGLKFIVVPRNTMGNIQSGDGGRICDLYS